MRPAALSLARLKMKLRPVLPGRRLLITCIAPASPGAYIKTVSVPAGMNPGRGAKSLNFCVMVTVTRFEFYGGGAAYYANSLPVVSSCDFTPESAAGIVLHWLRAYGPRYARRHGNKYVFFRPDGAGRCLPSVMVLVLS